ncbi:MAG: hypothetical protein B7Z52_03685, partial [Burkholderiales bacterium 12-64-5]
KKIALRLREFDSVNIQLEYGTLGRTQSQILRRFRWLVRAAPAVSVTFHTILDEIWMPLQEVMGRLKRMELVGAMATLLDNGRSHLLSQGVYGELRRQQRRKPVRIITHTKRDMRLLQDVHRLREVHHHPLSFVAAGPAAQIRAQARRADFPIVAQLPPEAKLIGTFGFLSPYKGFETAMEALRYLPEDHHLLVFGGIHPQAIARHQPRDPYITRLLDKGHIGQSLLDTLLAGSGATSLALDGSAKDLLARHPQDLHHRVHFMGVLSDSEFMAAMALCDSVVLPYLEVGQSSSGPIAMAVEMGCRVIASRTRAFLQYARYHPNRVEFFDIGNFAELAQRIEAGPPPSTSHRLVYDTQSNAALYLRVSLPPGMAPPERPAEPAAPASETLPATRVPAE